MKQSKIKIEPFVTDKNLSEIYQTSKITFAFLSAPRDGNKQCHQFVKCRDFLQDALRTSLTGVASKIYGFEFDVKKNPPIDNRKTRMIIRSNMADKEFEKVILKAEKLLHHYEHMAGVVSTSISKNGKDYILCSSNFWMFSPVLISLYTLLIRLGEYDLNFTKFDNVSLLKAYDTLAKSTKTDNEVSYVRSVKAYIHKIVINSHYVFTTLRKNNYDDIYFKDATIHTFHNDSGIVALCTATDASKIHHNNYKRLQDTLKDDVEKISDLPVVFCPGTYDISKYYAPNGWNFAVVDMVDDVHKVITQFAKCREQLTARFGKECKNKTFDKFNMCVVVDGTLDDSARMMRHKRELFLAKRVLNFIEAKYDIKKTTISTVCLKIAKTRRRYYSWLFSGSTEWLNSPVMLSLYSLIIRAVANYCSYSGKDPKNINDDVLDEIYSYRRGTNSYSNKDLLLLKSFCKQIDKILQNRKELFANDTTMADNYFVSEKKVKELVYANAPFSTIGVASLVNNQHIDHELQKKFKELKAC